MSERDRRIVLLTLTGRLAGLHQIQGVESQVLADLEAQTLPDFIEMGTEDGRSVSLVSANARWVLYRENRPPGGDDDTVEFNPAQV